MKIIDIEACSYEYIQVERVYNDGYKETRHFRCYPSGDWEELIGESWEPVYYEATILETIYKEYKSKTITDDLGNYWSVVCPQCGQNTMQVIRPGKVQCSECE